MSTSVENMVTPDQTTEKKASSAIVNVPNALSTIRLIMAFAVGILIELGLFIPAMITFVVAASTDFLDGWWARKFDQVTKLGRILDPFVDKIIITAALIALAATQNSGVLPWMVTLIIGREFLVTSLRAMIEGSGGDFSARWLGKWKMVFQCAAVVASLLLLDQPESTFYYWSTVVLMWAAVLITVASGADYVVQAMKLSRAK
ncbi:MAG: CDP-diacylglycerol--glycerol-3-phosphate 3-phosphatidyltransferase [Planctomycetota bacterium]